MTGGGSAGRAAVVGGDDVSVGDATVVVVARPGAVAPAVVVVTPATVVVDPLPARPVVVVWPGVVVPVVVDELGGAEVDEDEDDWDDVEESVGDEDVFGKFCVAGKPM